MNEKMRAGERELSARARLTFSTGASVWAEGEQVVSFAVREGADSPLLPGSVLCAEYELELANDDGQWRFGGSLRGNRPLQGATAELFVRCGREDAACGVFVVDSVQMDERGGTVRLCGGDSIGSELAAEFRDELSYPAALSQIWAALVAQSRYDWDAELPNGAAVIDAKPEWNGASLRRAAGWIAQAAGCFVRVGRSGALEVVPCRAETEAALTADDYLTMTDGLDVYGPVTGLRVTPMGAEEPTELSDGDGEEIAVTENPLFQSGAAHLTALMRGMLDEISGLTLGRMEVQWRGDPSLGVGARIALTDTLGNEHVGVITRQTLRFDQGFSAECACETPDAGDAGVLRAITPEGGVNAAALVGTVDGGRLAVGSVTARAIAAGSVTAGKLAAGAVETDRLAAGAVTAEKLAAGSVKAEKIEAGAVSADKLRAGSVTAEKLAAGAVEADKIKAGAVTAAKLAAGAVTAEKIASGTITADRLAAKTITAESGVIDDAAIGGAQIADGSITAAKIVSLNADVINAGTLSAERLVLVGDDGVIYKINAASSGLSLTELSKDQYKNYINGTVIVAKSITAAQIAARTITGNEILAGSITAKEINVSDLFASSATINALNAMDIRGNKYLQLYVTDAVDKVEVGGTNLLLGTGQSVTTPAGDSSSNQATHCYHTTANDRPQAHEDIVLSCDVEVSSGATGTFVLQYDDNNYHYRSASSTLNIADYTTKKRIVCTRTNPDIVFVNMTVRRDNATGTLTISNAKLERGNKATDWSPAPEDTDGKIDALETRMSEAELKITSDAIVSTVTSSASYKTLSSTASTAKSTAETAKSSAETAQSTADTAKTNAANAQSTANTAKSTADTAKSKADSNATDITGLKARMTTAESEILQKADSITLSVLETKVDGISVGGTNLLLGTGQSVTTPAGDSSSNQATHCYHTTTNDRPQAHEDIVLSCDVEASSGATGTFVLQYDDNNYHYRPASSTLNIADYTTKKRIVCTITNPDIVFVNMTVRRDNATGTLTISNAKLERGNKATDWSPAPEDPAGSLSISSDYSKVDINTQRVRIVSKQMEVAVPADDGEDDVMRVDADGVHAEVVEADQVVSDSVVSTQGAIVYTPANGGALAAFLDELSGKHLTGRVYIDCKNVASGNYTVEKLSGEGLVTLTNGTMNQLKIDSCGSTTVYVLKVNFSNSGTALLMENSLAVFISGCVINASTGIVMGDGWPTRAVMYNCSGDCSVMARVNWTSELRIVGSSKPTGTLQLSNGAEVYNGTPDPTFAAKASPSIPTTQTVTVSLSPTNTYTLRGTSNSDGNKLYQGRYSSSQGMRKGVMLFTLPSDLTSASNIDSAVLTLRRISGAGQGGGVTVQVRCFDQTGTAYGSATAYGGQTVSIDVTDGVKAMKTNGYTGLMLYNPDTTLVSGKSYTASYARFAGNGESGAPVLKISYRK